MSSLLTNPDYFEVRFALPFRKNEFFVGRQDALMRLSSILDKAPRNHIAVVYGIGGIGKTELVTQYIFSSKVFQTRPVL